MAFPLLLAGVCFASCLVGVKGQSTLAKCDSTMEDYTWMTNSRGQNPCLVAAYLYVPCLGPVEAQVPPLDADRSGYGASGNPQSAQCDCNTVVYTLLQACAACQATWSGKVVSLEQYGGNCTDMATSYPDSIPPGTAIPQWAFQDVETTGSFDVSVAQLTGDTPESTALPTSTSTTITSTSSTSATTSSSASSTAGAIAESGSSSHKSSNIGAIVGGVVGGVLGLLMLGTTIFYLLRRQRDLDKKAQAEVSERPMSTVTDDGPQPSLKPMSIMTVPSVIYDPDDPRTFPSGNDPSPFGIRAASPDPSLPAGHIAGHMHSFSALQDYSALGQNGSQYGYGYATSAYKGTPEL